MRKTVICVIAVAALAVVPLLAQSGNSETLNALLVEVRLLRQALERNATAPQLQLLGTRLEVQNARLQAAIANHETARNALREAMASIEDLTAPTPDNDPAGQTPEQLLQQRLLSEQRKALAAAASRSLPELQAKEAELAAALAEEQNQWQLLNRRLDEIERTLVR